MSILLYYLDINLFIKHLLKTQNYRLKSIVRKCLKFETFYALRKMQNIVLYEKNFEEHELRLNLKFLLLPDIKCNRMLEW